MPSPQPLHGAVVVHTSKQVMPFDPVLAPFGTVGLSKHRVDLQTGGGAVYVADLAAIRSQWPPPAPCPTWGSDLYFTARTPSQSLAPAPLLPRGQLTAALVLCKVPAGSQLIAIQPPKVSWGVRFFGCQDFPSSEVAGSTLQLVREGTEVPYWGAPCGIVVGETAARVQWVAAEMSQSNLVVSSPKTDPLVLPSQARLSTLLDGHLRGEFSATRGDATAAFEKYVGMKGWEVASGSFQKGGQLHWYMEPQAVYVEVDEGGRIIVNSSTQSTGFVQQVVSATNAIEMSNVEVRCRRLGGGFGGKFVFPGVIASLAVLAARSTGRPVQLVIPREVDSQVVGGRPRMDANYKLLVNKQTGLMEALQVDIVMAIGATDNFWESTAAKELDGCYWIPHVSVRLRGFRTASAGCQPVRGPGHHEGSLLAEIIADHGAHTIGLDSADFRGRNFLTSPVDGLQFGPAGQQQIASPISDTHVIPLLFESLKRGSKMAERQRDVAKFNAGSPFRKRGVGVSMIRYDINRFGEKSVLVNLYPDGSVILHVSGIDMGQGLHTKAIMMARRTLSLALPAELRPLPVHIVSIADTSSSVLNGLDVTGGAVGSEMTVFAIEDACLQIIDRIKKAGVSTPAADSSTLAAWKDVVGKAWPDMFSTGLRPPSLSALGKYSATSEEAAYTTYCGSVVEAEVDGLTGEYQIRHASVHFEGGPVMHGGVDIGQVEGAYLMGLGAMTSEEVLYNPRTSRFMNDNTWRYKLPVARDLPMDFRVELTNCGEHPFGQGVGNGSAHHESNRRLLSSRATGEPPLLAASAVLSALRASVAAFGDGRSFVQLPAPCTVDVLRAECGRAMATAGVRDEAHARL
eukprot:gnl/MRDRNA2_/MRDRNA2_79451_c0_seq4.p1 gnl/MRDRNA2_/MRDRNA2_79451_c0~~gnl/MRDRNA2_/MRDRNA2_79451_c0_seq4.p1  ORF type:complete len:886 (+),score=133.74 gnl/MRDRNA2_/MRDRNA2_79451_c0_seq4:98-2659(+)